MADDDAFAVIAVGQADGVASDCDKCAVKNGFAADLGFG